MINSTDPETAGARNRLLEVVARCAADRHAFFPRHARTLLENAQVPGLVVFGTRGLGFPQQLDQIEYVAGLNPGMRILAVVDDAETPAAPDRQTRYPMLSIDEFFTQPDRFSGCLVVDRTCTWHPGVRYKVRLKQKGFAYLRLEQFLNAPGLETGAGYYRTHSDEMFTRFDEFLALESVWSDEPSRQAYYFALAAFISMKHEFFAFHCGDYTRRYFPEDIGFSFGPSTVFADCGAHDGHEALYFAGLVKGAFRALHTFEPNKQNFINVCNNVNRYIAEHGAMPIYCHELGVYDRNAFLGSSGYDGGVTVVDEAAGSRGVHVCRLDDMLEQLDLLRLEIEGAELAALHGARGLIEKCRPLMTLSAYHKPTDFLDIVGFVRDLGLNYSMKLRHQSLEPGVLCVYCQ